jgi:tetrahydromethanopterin S-methyltransferase subunit B
MATQYEILLKSRSLLGQAPFRTTFERENFLYGNLTGARLLIALCKEIENLNLLLDASKQEWERTSILNEMNIISEKISEIEAEVGTDVAKSLEDAEPEYWVGELARKAAVEALCQNVTTENMGQMLKLPAELYEESITRCQTFLNVINKTTRLAERKANVANVRAESQE